MGGIAFLFVVDADGREVDRVEYDTAEYSAAVVKVAEALDVSPAVAHGMVAESNPGAEKTSADMAREYADDLAARGEGLTVTDRPPAPLPAASVTQLAASEG